MTTHCPTGRDFVLSEAQTNAMRKMDALHARLALYAGSDLSALFDTARAVLEPALAEDFADRIGSLGTAMLRAREALRSAEDGMREADERRARLDVRERCHQYLCSCRQEVRVLELKVSVLREELESYALRSGARISAEWPVEAES
jgi:hypothetical protein